MLWLIFCGFDSSEYMLDFIVIFLLVISWARIEDRTEQTETEVLSLEFFQEQICSQLQKNWTFQKAGETDDTDPFVLV